MPPTYLTLPIRSRGYLHGIRIHEGKSVKRNNETVDCLRLQMVILCSKQVSTRCENQYAHNADLTIH